MDERLKQALDFSNYTNTLNDAKRIMIEKYKSNLVMLYKGGQFNCTRELVNFCSNMLHLERDDLVVLDENNQPVLVENLKDFAEKVQDTYLSASYEYYNEYKLLIKNRSIEGLVNL
jgi:hypothetical protein